MQLGGLTGSADLSPGLRLASFTWTCHFICEVWDTAFLWSFPRKGWLGKQVDKGSTLVTELSC